MARRGHWPDRRKEGQLIDSDTSVQIGGRQSASAVFHGLIKRAFERHTAAFEHLSAPHSAQQFKSDYPSFLPAFEAARLASSDRLAIAQGMVDDLATNLVWQGGSEEPLLEHLSTPGAALPLQYREPRGTPGWAVSFENGGKRWQGAELAELGSSLAARAMVTPGVAGSLEWACEHLINHETVCLPGRKIVVIGAGAEMAPTRQWVEAGAEVLWLDIAPPSAAWLDSLRASGPLHWPEGGADLLRAPRDILATIIAFAQDEPVDIALYAYAPGQAREIRLTATMNAIVDSLPPELIASLTLLVSPTTPTVLLPSDLDAMERRLEARPTWERLMAGAGLLGRGGGSERHGEAAVTRTVVGIQGVSYQLAQYVCKVLAAERWLAAYGNATRVSASTAAITRTRSLDHPVFDAAFEGASAFRVETLTPEQSRQLNGLLAVVDWLRPETPEPGAVRVHGGIHTLPYPLEGALKVAAAFGFARSPRLLAGLLRR